MDIKKYKGFEVEFDTEREVFIGRLNGESYSDSSYKKLTDKIDKALKQNLGDTQVYYLGGWGGGIDYKIGKLTSVNIDDNCCWINKSGSGREKIKLSSAYIFNNKNTSVIKEMKEIQSQVDALDKKIDRLRETLENYKP